MATDSVDSTRPDPSRVKSTTPTHATQRPSSCRLASESFFVYRRNRLAGQQCNSRGVQRADDCTQLETDRQTDRQTVGLYIRHHVAVFNLVLRFYFYAHLHVGLLRLAVKTNSPRVSLFVFQQQSSGFRLRQVQRQARAPERI